ncbi:RNaseE [Mycobacterium phage Typha]|uniref:RNaseE n=1 Tax=Mycobacterium phage Typha TaxID=2517971 RepID=A0A482JAJ4_9CAUD|nr:Rnase E [Mycobacterium phage Typha]QBP29665.1 RNaseE [Mycobacterium phage Typha]
MNRVERARRDAKVLRLHIAGATYRQIAEACDISVGMADKIVKRELAKAAARRDLLGDQALAMFLERSESLFKANYPKAMKGDYKAAVICDRIMARQARLFGVVDGHGIGGAGNEDPEPPDTEDDPEDDGDDELAKWRSRRRA